MANKNKNRSFLMQGGTLASAAIIGRLIGLIYRIPLTSIIGDEGNNYYGCAFDIYNIMLLISSYSLPMAVSKLVSSYRSKGELKNAYKVLKCATGFALAVGSAACLLVFFGARYITGTIFHTPLSLYALWVLAPTLLITALLGIYRGFFQGMENMFPSAVSQVLEQLVNAAVSVLAAYFLSSGGMRIGKVLANESGYRAAYGAAGAALGTTVGAAVSLVFLYILFRAFSRSSKRRMGREHARKVTSRQLFRIMLLTVLPILGASVLYNINIVAEQGIFKHMMKDAASPEQISAWWGIFSGKFKTLVNFPVAVAAAIGAACIPGIASARAKKDKGDVEKKTELVIRFCVLIAFPFSFGLMLLSAPIMEFLFQDTEPLASGLLLAGGATIIFYSLSTVAMGILQGIGKLRLPVINSAAALILHLITLVVLLKYTDLKIYAVVAAMAVFSISATLLDLFALVRCGVWTPEFMKTFLLPAVCAMIMASFSWVIEFGLSQVTVHKYVTVPVAIVCGILIYFALLLILRALTKEEMKMFPGGRLVLRLMGRLARA